jgi:Undecaprenyl-phosphate galactose phosphotransferase WbaP
VGGEELVSETRLRDAIDTGRSVGRRVSWITVLAATDALVLAAVSALAVRSWAVVVRSQPASLYFELLPLLALFLLGYAKGGLYPGFGIGAVQTLRRLSMWTSYVFVVLAAASFVLKLPHQYSRGTFLLAWIGSLCALPIARFAVLSLVSRSRWWGEPVVVIGTGSQARRTIRSLRHSLTLGYRPRCVLSMQDHQLTTVEDLPVVGGIESVERLANLGFQVAILAVEEVGNRGRIVEYLQYHFRHVLVVPQGESIPIEGVEIRNLGGVLGIEFRNQLLRRRSRILKRTLDIIIAAVASVVTAPLVAMAALLVRLADGGPAFFFQERVGLHGTTIRVRKLRTMYLDASERLEAHLDLNPEARSEWESRFKLLSDPRILPRIGSLMRRFSIDELPQLWQVVKGELSLVGPRPFPLYHLRKFPADFQILRKRVRPGITGLWQVMVRSAGGLEEQRLHDSYYIRNWSIWMDLYILARTTITVVSGRGAH